VSMGDEVSHTFAAFDRRWAERQGVIDSGGAGRPRALGDRLAVMPLGAGPCGMDHRAGGPVGSSAS
jgi:hypothetical protein